MSGFGAVGLAAVVGLAGLLTFSHVGCVDEPAAGPESGGSPSKKGADEMVSEQQAIELARAACRGKVGIPEAVQPRVTREEMRWVVVFPTNLPPDTLGADYYARVILDAQTGAVLELLSGD